MESNHTSPPARATSMPNSVYFIVGTEAAERFSFYGMNAILVPFMTGFMLNSMGQPDRMTDAQASQWFHTFSSMVYFMPFFGAFLADSYLGKYRLILYLSIVYCFGHLVLAFNQTRPWLALGLGLIALGAGGIKPCVSAYVGDQFDQSNKNLISRAFNWFYFAINSGSTFSTILIPYLLDGFCRDFGISQSWGPHLAFGTPGLFMLAATCIFWAGRKSYVRPKLPSQNFFRQFADPEIRSAIGNLVLLMPFVAMFWSVWYQNFSSWVKQAEHLDRHFLQWNLLPAQLQTANPILILLFLPLFSYVIYPAVNKVIEFTPLRRIGTGLFLGVLAFLISAWIESRITGGARPSFWWQILAYVVLTAAEILVSVTHLEFCYTQAPRRMKSLVVSLYLLTISLGNAFTAVVSKLIQHEDGSSKLTGASYYLFYSGTLFVAACIFVGIAVIYKGKTYIQETSEAETA